MLNFLKNHFVYMYFAILLFIFFVILWENLLQVSEYKYWLENFEIADLYKGY